MKRYNAFDAKVQTFCKEQELFYNCNYLGHSSKSLTDTEPYALVTTNWNLSIVSKVHKKLWDCASTEVNSVDLKENNIIITLFDAHGTGNIEKNILAASNESARKLYVGLYLMSRNFGNQLKPLQQLVVETLDQKSDKLQKDEIVSISQHGDERQYVFGSLNNMSVTGLKMSNTEVFNLTSKKFQSIKPWHTHNESSGLESSKYSYYESIDKCVVQLIKHWENNNSMLSPTRILCVLFVNNSDLFIHLKTVELKEGKNYLILGVGEGYDRDSRIINPYGAVLLIAYASRQTLFDPGMAKLHIETDVCNVQASTRNKSRSPFGLNSFGGHSVGFTEKSITSSFAKCVILINQ